MASGNAASWYHAKLTNNYAAHTAVGSWTRYSTRTGMTFDGLTLAELKVARGSELIEMISVQTDSGWNGFDGDVDGLEITLTSGDVGRVDFTTGTYVTVVPNEVPDETVPRVVMSAPAGYGKTAWQGPASGKSNWHAWYDEEGYGTLSTLFPEDAATLDLGDIQSLAYSTLRPTGAAGRDWWVSIYTRPDGDDTGWYHARYISNFDDHSVENAWVRYTTAAPSGAVPALTFRAQDASGAPIGNPLTLAELFAQDGQPILAITLQTASGWNGFDGYVDGLEVTLTDGKVGKVNLGDGITVPVAPHQVPDEQRPRVNVNDAPAAFDQSRGRGLPAARATGTPAT